MDVKSRRHGEDAAPREAVNFSCQWSDARKTDHLQTVPVLWIREPLSHNLIPGNVFSLPYTNEKSIQRIAD